MAPSIPSITGGAATSGNGDTAFSADNAKLGGLNYNNGTGINQYVLLGLVAIGVYFYVSRKTK